MSEVRNKTRPVFEPDLRMLGIIFDQLWECVEPEFAKHFYRVEDTHIRLATIILKLGADGQLRRHQIAATASRLIRQARPYDNDR